MFHKIKRFCACTFHGKFHHVNTLIALQKKSCSLLLCWMKRCFCRCYTSIFVTFSHLTTLHNWMSATASSATTNILKQLDEFKFLKEDESQSHARNVHYNFPLVFIELNSRIVSSFYFIYIFLRPSLFFLSSFCYQRCIIFTCNE